MQGSITFSWRRTRPWLLLFTFGAAVWTLAPTALAQAPVQAPVQAPAPDPTTTAFDRVRERARSLAAAAYESPPDNLPAVLRDMDYSAYRAINYLPDAALWAGQALFEVQFFHPGFIYRSPVHINVVPRQGEERRYLFSPDQFRYGPPAAAAGQVTGGDLGFAGLRVHYPLNTSEYKDEFVVFQGASYFRLVGPGQLYGLSARGLAIDTAEPTGEEFPLFTEFWLVEPAPEDDTLTLLALLDSRSVSGAYRFDLKPGVPTAIDVTAELHFRRDVTKVGIAPLTSMFHHGENHSRFVDDFRPEVHDSDGVLLHTSRGEWNWRPLSNPRHLQVTSLQDDTPRGFGLMQRDRDFANYQDTEANYERRPSFWVTPGGGWGRGRLELVEIPTDSETNDNIVAYWVPERKFEAEQTFNFSYRLESLSHTPAQHNLAQVERTRIGWAALPGQKNPPPRTNRQFVVDFAGHGLDALGRTVPIRPNLQVLNGQATDLILTKLPKNLGWRVAFKLQPNGQDPVDMRLFLELRDQRLSEVWNYVWSPSQID